MVRVAPDVSSPGEQQARGMGRGLWEGQTAACSHGLRCTGPSSPALSPFISPTALT